MKQLDGVLGLVAAGVLALALKQCVVTIESRWDMTFFHMVGDVIEQLLDDSR